MKASRPPRRSDPKPSTKKRLLFVRRTIGFGGSEVVILDLLKAIDYEANIVFLATPVDVFSQLLTDLKLPVICLPLTAPFAGGFFRLFVSWIGYLRRCRPDKIILAEGAFRDFPFSAALAAFTVARGNLWMMELHPATEPAAENAGAPWRLISKSGMRERVRAWLSRGILSDSQGIKDCLVRGYGYPPEKIGVVYMGVDTKRFSPASQETRRALREDLQIPDAAFVVVSTARLYLIKRLDRLIRAFGALSAHHNDLWLLLTGDGPLRDELQSLARSVNNSRNIKFLGHVKDVGPILQASDIYVLPSDEEGFGIALVEAMACELVCVATRTIGPSEIVEDGVTGFLTERSDNGVLQGLDQALRLNVRERETIGNRARQRVLDNFRVEEFAVKGLAFMEINRVEEYAG
jgi:glycosyltransferase involved in cell wall biosynthesis